MAKHKRISLPLRMTYAHIFGEYWVRRQHIEGVYGIQFLVGKGNELLFPEMYKSGNVVGSLRMKEVFRAP